MATGDNGLTALSVGKQCGIIRSDVPIFLGELESHDIKWTNVERIKEWLKEEVSLQSSWMPKERTNAWNWTFDQIYIDSS